MDLKMENDFPPRTLVMKGQYAQLRRRTPGAVSHWIRTGKISAAAIVGEGRDAKIWVEQADRDLAASLDPRQQALHELPLGSPSIRSDDAVEAAAPSTPIYSKEQARKLRAEAEIKEIELGRLRGDILMKTDVEAAEHAYAATFIDAIESIYPVFAADLIGLTDPSSARAALKKIIREQRTRAAQRLHRIAEAKRVTLLFDDDDGESGNQQSGRNQS